MALILEGNQRPTEEDIAKIERDSIPITPPNHFCEVNWDKVIEAAKSMAKHNQEYLEKIGQGNYFKRDIY